MAKTPPLKDVDVGVRHELALALRDQLVAKKFIKLTRRLLQAVQAAA
jgi:hypothetical protein